ncbi:hypothetical protein KIPE111705_09375 [Kibdelosporangium persicum]|uniref:DUF3800 domain-containing protein n=1 Tax=Kibdelosporangium persicum TaxID=2698649 RepID=A0ABX2FCS0_9PSEU|nr:hypothetical protein [Kibdelosporangium persicum]
MRPTGFSARYRERTRFGYWDAVTVHMFVDESERGCYLLAAALIPVPQLQKARTLLRGLCLPGERRLHFKMEKDSRRRFIISRLVAAGFHVRVYFGKGPSEAVRGVLLEQVVADAIDLGVRRLILDSRDPGGNARDRSRLARTPVREHDLMYEHLPSSSEPGTWIADAVAWCHGAGGDWRRRVDPLVEHVFDAGVIQ